MQGRHKLMGKASAISSSSTLCLAARFHAEFCCAILFVSLHTAANRPRSDPTCSMTRFMASEGKRNRWGVRKSPSCAAWFRKGRCCCGEGDWKKEASSGGRMGAARKEDLNF